MFSTSDFSHIRENVLLNGDWSFALDPADIGEGDQWYAHDFATTTMLPGSWAEGGYGEAPTSRFLAAWNPVREYEGAAWYTRILDIPAEWENRVVELVLKGVRWRSQVWIDQNLIGQGEALSIPHSYDLTPYLNPGTRQRLSIRVDNRMIYPLDESHINSEQTATHWGGITVLVLQKKLSILRLNRAIPLISR
jgi:beta-galactosidase